MQTSAPSSLSPSIPQSHLELFWAFTKMALQGFGGVLPVAERVLVHERRWLAPKEFVETLAIAQALPGPNVCNMALMIGDRFMGARGAFTALAGMLTVPALIVIALTVAYQHFAENMLVQAALLGMGAAAVGLIIGMGIRLAKTQGHYRVGWLLGGMTFIGMALAGYSLGIVLLATGLPSFLIRYWQIRHKEKKS